MDIPLYTLQIYSFFLTNLKKLQHFQKKSLMKNSKGIVTLYFGKLFFFFFLHSILIIRIQKLVVRKTRDVNLSHGFVNSFSEFLEILFVCCRNKQGVFFANSMHPSGFPFFERGMSWVFSVIKSSSSIVKCL